MATLAAGYLVDLVQKDDARVFHAINGDSRDLIHIDQALLFFLYQIFEGLVDLQLAFLGALAEEVGQHVFDVDIHLLNALVGDDLERWEIAFANVNFYHAVIQLALAQLLAQFFPSSILRFR